MIHYSKTHIKAIQARLNEYDEKLKTRKFNVISECEICDTTRELPGNSINCRICLFGPNTSGCFSHFITGAQCEDQSEQRRQRAHLVRKLNINGYDYK